MKLALPMNHEAFMTPQEIDLALTTLEALPDETRQKLKAIEEDAGLSPEGRDRSRRQLREKIERDFTVLETDDASAVQGRLDKLDAEIDHERRRFFDPGRPASTPDGGDAGDPVVRLLQRLDSHSCRSDLRQRWNLMSGAEMTEHYSQLLRLDDRTLIELYEAEAARLLASRGDSEGETALRVAGSKARNARVSDRERTLQRAQERARIHSLRLDNAAALFRSAFESI